MTVLARRNKSRWIRLMKRSGRIEKHLMLSMWILYQLIIKMRKTLLKTRAMASASGERIKKLSRKGRQRAKVLILKAMAEDMRCDPLLPLFSEN
jgi:hypothetical protein